VAASQAGQGKGKKASPSPKVAAALAALWLLAAPLASAQPADPAALAGQAAKHCRSGDLGAASAALRELLSALEASLGPGHDASHVVRLNLAHVERARGDERAASQLEALPEGAKRGSPDKKLKRALRKLRVCAAVRGETKPEAPEIASKDQVNLARNLLNRGKYREALAMVNDARKSAGASASAQDLMRLYETLALIELQLGHTDEALRAASAAGKIARQRGDVELRITLARLTAQLGDLDRASQELDALEGEARSKKLRGELEEARGDVALRLGSPRRALEHLERALADHRAAFGRAKPSTAAVLHLRGDAYRVAGDFPAAQASYRQAREIRSKALGEAHAETARTSNAIGVLRADLGDWQGADDAFAQALATLEAALGREHPETLTVGSNRALARWGATESADAAQAYAEVVEALSRALGEEHPSVAAALRNLARIELERGRTEQAAKLLERTLAVQKRSLGEAHPALAPTRLARARLLAGRGDTEAAAAEVDRAIAVLVAARGPEHPLVARARTLRARIAVAQGDDAAAFEQAVQASGALASYTRHTFGAISDRQRALLAEDSHDVIGALLSAERAPPRELFVALLPHRDSVLRSIAATHAASAGGGELGQLRRRYVAAVLGRGPDAAGRIKELAARIDGLETKAAGGARAAERDPEEVLARACARLPEDAALVKFVAYDRTPRGAPGELEPAHAALVVRGAGCEVRRVSLAGGDSVERAAEAFAAAMRAERADDPKSRAALAEQVLAPLHAALGKAQRWFVIPDGALWGVPLGVLPDPEAPNRYLFERVTIGYLTSTYELAEAGRGAPIDASKLRSLLVGAPEFGGGERGPVVLTDTGPCQLAPFEPLPATREELEDVGSLVGSPSSLVGADVTKPRLEAELRHKPWILHFATHAYFAGLGGCGPSEPGGTAWREGEAPIAPNPLLLSGIALAGANEPARVGSEAQRGILTAYEVAGLDLRSTGLVVLSACDTGTGLHLRGQEVQGLRWGFRAAGARALVTSLWRSNDLATRRLMRSFYEALVSGEIARDPFRGAEALRRAQLAQVASERRFGMQRPLIWANFIFSGVL
jgi:CHAT domain-containing protein/predicted negative regulator of RcsB-dependent stress response